MYPRIDLRNIIFLLLPKIFFFLNKINGSKIIKFINDRKKAISSEGICPDRLLASEFITTKNIEAITIKKAAFEMDSSSDFGRESS